MMFINGWEIFDFRRFPGAGIANNLLGLLLFDSGRVIVTQYFVFGRILTVGGPQPLVNGVRIPISRVKSPQLSLYFRPFIRLINPHVVTIGSGPKHSCLPNIQDIFQWPIHDKSGSLERLRFGSEKLGFTGVSPGFVGAESSSCWKNTWDVFLNL